MGTCFNKNETMKNKTVRVDQNEIENKKCSIATSNQNDEETKFENMEEISDVFVGEGIKRMKAYKCDLKIDQLEKMRTQFWGKIKINFLESRKKNRNVWKTIRMAIMTDIEKSQGILKQHNINTIDGCINACVDSTNYLYLIPNYCIHYPFFEKELLNNIPLSLDETLKINLFDLYENKKYVVDLPSSITGIEIKQIFSELAQINFKLFNIRLLFGGAEIKDNQSIYQHKLHGNFTIQVMKQKIE